MIGSQPLTALFDTVDDSLRVLSLALEGTDVSRVHTAADEIAELRRDLADQGLVADDE